MTKHPTRSASEKVDTSTKPGRGGKRAGSGRKPGVPNKTTASAKEAFTLAAEGVGGVPALTAWGILNPDKFWPLYARLIPTDVTTAGEKISGVVILPAMRD
jgi:hypothetical protein